MRLEPRLALPLILLAAVLTVIAQLILGLPYQVRFSHPAFDYIALAVAILAVPTLILWASIVCSSKWLGRIGFVVVTLLAVPALLISGLAMLGTPKINEVVDVSHQFLREARVGSVVYRLYRTDCGATCAYGLSLRKERDLIFGIRLVSPLWSRDRTDKGELVVKDATIQIVDGTNVLGEAIR